MLNFSLTPYYIFDIDCTIAHLTDRQNQFLHIQKKKKQHLKETGELKFKHINWDDHYYIDIQKQNLSGPTLGLSNLYIGQGFQMSFILVFQLPDMKSIAKKLLTG